MLPINQRIHAISHTYLKRTEPQIFELPTQSPELQGSPCVWELDANDHQHYLTPGTPQSSLIRSSHISPSGYYHHYNQPLLVNTPDSDILCGTHSSMSTNTTNLPVLPYPSHRTIQSTSSPASPVRDRNTTHRIATTEADIPGNPRQTSPSIPLVISPLDYTHWDSQDFPSVQLNSGELEADQSRESSFSATATCSLHEASLPPVSKQPGADSCHVSTQLPAPPNSSPQEHGNIPNSYQSYLHNPGVPNNERDITTSRPANSISPDPSLASVNTHDSFEDPGHGVNCFEELQPWNQVCTSVPRSQLHYQRMYTPEEHIISLRHKNDHSQDFNEALPMYSVENASYMPSSQIQASEEPHSQAQTFLEAHTTRFKNKKGKLSIASACTSFFHPLPCRICGKEFTGPYQNGNLRRHLRQIHPLALAMTEPSDITCRECKKVYRRGDARRKHEWKKHRIEDAKPEKRRKEKKCSISIMVGRV